MLFLAFLGSCALLAMIPGVSTAVILRQTLREGRASGLAATLGNETGIFLWAMAAVFGLSALVLASEAAYGTLKIVGAHVPVTLALLAAVWVLVDLVWYVALIWTVSKARAVFSRSSTRRRLEQISGAVLIGLGIRLVVESR